MPAITIELLSQEKQTHFNLRRWAELLGDPEVNRIEWRVETDRYGHVIVMPPPAPKHGAFQALIAHLLKTLMSNGTTMTECPVSTADGVKAADAAWASPAQMAKLGDKSCFPRSPEICVEVLSPDNTDAEIREKMELYFDAGATETWVCDLSGTMSFFGPGLARLNASKLCPNFPEKISIAD